MANQIIPPENGFTTKWLDNLKPPEKRTEIPDPKTKGLRLRVSPTGAKTFVWLFRFSGEINRLTLGKYSNEFTLSKARKCLLDAREKLDRGIDPRGPTHGPDTVKRLVEEFYTVKSKQLKRPERMRQVLDHDILKPLGKKKVKEITPRIASDVVTKVISRDATAHAGTVLDALRQVFDFAVTRGYIETSPAAHIKASKIGVSRSTKDRALDFNSETHEFDESLAEIRTFWHALDNSRISNSIKTGLKILLLTGVRSGELRLAEWQHIDLENKVWTIPVKNQKLTVARAKTAKPFRVPLTDFIIEQFNLLKPKYGEDCTWVMAGKNSHIEDKAMARAVKRLLRNVEMEHFTPHDLRRTLRTHLSRLEIAPHVAEKCLNHSLGKIFETYAKSDYLSERKEALQKWSDSISLLVKEHDNVMRVHNEQGWK